MDQKTEIVVAMCQEIARCEDIISLDWESISLVVDVEDGSTANRGFAYLNNGDIVPFSVRSEKFYNYCYELPEAMQVIGKDAWTECLVQIRRADGEIKMDFNYDQTPRWAIGPRTLARMREELRPVFD